MAVKYRDSQRLNVPLAMKYKSGKGIFSGLLTHIKNLMGIYAK